MLARQRPCLRRRSGILQTWLRRSLVRLQTADDSAHPDLSPRTLSHYWQTEPPSPGQLAHAAQFFERQPVQMLWSSPRLVTMPFDESPEVCFLGRSNVGKSSLLNALMGKNVAHTSARPGRTRSMNAFRVGNDTDPLRRLVVLDMPGYGKGARAEWGAEILKYLEKRRKLQRIFLLVDGSHGLKATDVALLELLVKHKVSYQIVLSKIDRVLLPEKKIPKPEVLQARLDELATTFGSLRDQVEPPDDTEEDEEEAAVGEILSCSSETMVDGKRLGIDALRFAMLRAAGLEAASETKPQKAVPERIISFEELERMQQRQQSRK